MSGTRRYENRAAFGGSSGSGGGVASVVAGNDVTVTGDPLNPTVGVSAALSGASFITMVAEAGLSNETILSQVNRADVIANRGAFGNPGVLFYATDTGLLYRDSGAAWVLEAFAESQITNLVSDLAAKFATATSLGGDLSGTLPNPLVPQLATTRKIGNITVLAHSYSAGSTQSDSGVANVYQQSCISKVQAILGIHEENVRHFGQAASRLTAGANNVSTSQLAGWVTALQFFVPNSSINVDAANDVVLNHTNVASLGALIVIHGINDIEINPTSFPTQGITAWKHAMRSIISRHRVGQWYGSTCPAGTISWDASITFTGTWTDLATVVANSGPAVKRSNTNADSVTITLPTNFPGGVVAVCFISEMNGMTTLSGTMTNVTTSMPVTAAGEFPSAGNYVARIEAEGANTAEDVLVTGGQGTTTWTVTRGVNGTAASAHGAAAVVTIEPTTLVTWSTNGANAGITGTTTISGQGFSGSQVAVTKRFVCTTADAGKTIVATISGKVASSSTAQAAFDSWWLEATDPPPAVIADVPYWWYAGIFTSITFAQLDTIIQSINTATASVVAEFDSWVKKLDTYTTWKNRAGLITGAMNNTDVTTTIGWTANSNSFTPQIGDRMSFGKLFTREWADVTAVSGSAPNWTLTLTRGAGGTTKAAHSSGDFLSNLQYMHSDEVHLSQMGHSVFAQAIIDAFTSMPTPTLTQIAQMEGNWSQTSQALVGGLIDNNWMTAPINTFATVAVAQNTECAFPVYIPRDCFIVGVASVVQTGTAATIRHGLYFPDATHSRPGRLLVDFGTQIDSGKTAPWVSQKTGLYQLVRPGWYWISTVQQATAITLRTIAANGLNTPGLSAAAVTTGTSLLVGYSRTGMSGALTDWAAWTEEAATPNMPIVWLRTRSTNFA